MVVDDLPLFRVGSASHLAIDTTLGSTFDANGLPRRVGVDGVAFQVARRRQERRHPEFARHFGRARLVVFAVEVCGRWSQESQSFLSSLVHAKARSVTSLMRKGVCKFSVCVGLFLLLHRCAGCGVFFSGIVWCKRNGDCPPSCEVERDFRHVGLSLQFCVCGCG